MGTLYAIGWQAHGAPRRWQWTELETARQAAEIARANVRFDGGGRWRVYETPLESSGGRARTVRGRLLAEGVEPMARDPSGPTRGPPSTLTHSGPTHRAQETPTAARRADAVQRRSS